MAAFADRGKHERARPEIRSIVESLAGVSLASQYLGQAGHKLLDDLLRGIFAGMTGQAKICRHVTCRRCSHGRAMRDVC
jgi:hypothetical protein